MSALEKAALGLAALLAAQVAPAKVAMSKMQRAAAAADSENLVTNTALSSAAAFPVTTAAATLTSPASAPSSSGYTNIMPVAQGFAASFTAVATPGSPVLTSIVWTGGASLASLNAGMFLLGSNSGFTFPLNTAPGATIVSVDTVGLTITMSKPAPSTATGISATIYVATDKIDYIGGVPATYGANLIVSGVTVTSAAPACGASPCALEFETDVAGINTLSPGIWLQFYQNGSVPNWCRVAIDNVYQTSQPLPFSTSGSAFLAIQFLTPGVHKVRIELPAGYIIQQLWVYNPGAVWKPADGADLHVAMFADSWFQNGEAGSWGLRNIPHTLALLLGWKPDLASQGGTGYVNAGGVNFAWTSSYRSVGDVRRRAYVALVFFGSVNDSGSAGSQAAANATIAPAALQTWQNARAANPNAPIIIFGCPTTVAVSATTAGYIENALLLAFSQWGDANAKFVPITTDPAGPWLTTANAAWPTGGYLAQTTASITTTLSSSTITLNSVSSGPTIALLQPISAPGIPANTYINALVSGTLGAAGSTYTLSANATAGATVSASIGDGNHPSDGVGTLYIVQRMAAKIRQWVNAQVVY